MCRNIRVLHHFDPPTTPEEVRAAALQFVRKVTGLRQPSQADAAAFDEAVAGIDAVTGRLLGALQARTAVRTREAERERARQRGRQRDQRRGGSARG